MYIQVPIKSAEPSELYLVDLTDVSDALSQVGTTPLYFSR